MQFSRPRELIPRIWWSARLRNQSLHLCNCHASFSSFRDGRICRVCASKCRWLFRPMHPWLLSANRKINKQIMIGGLWFGQTHKINHIQQNGRNCVTLASYELLAKRGSTSTSSSFTLRNGVFGAELVLLFNDVLLFPFLILNDELLDSDNFRFLPLTPFSSPFSDSSCCGLAKPPDTNWTGLKFGVLVTDGFSFCTAFGCNVELFVSLSLSSLSSLLDESFLAAAGFPLLFASFGFFAAFASSESLLSSEDDSAFRLFAPFVTAGLAGAW